VTQDDGWASLSLVAKISLRCRGLFRPRGDYRKVAYVDHVRCMVRDPMWVEREKHVTC
jgi:hypothetical protein